MQRVVEEATGRRVAGDYRQAYFAAGATEVTASLAAAGDIIQLTDPGGGNSIEPHTAIILKNLGNRRFDVIDSNQAWDEVVRLRGNYAPYEIAAQRGGVIHIYRMPKSTTLMAGDAHFTAASHSWSSGQIVVVTKDQGCLSLRRDPSLEASESACLVKGESATASGETRDQGGTTWAGVTAGVGDGWLATTFLAPATWTEVRASAAAQPAPAAKRESAVTAAAVAPPTASVAAKPSWLLPVLSRTARVDASSGCLNVRSAPTSSALVVRCLPAGSAVFTVEGSPGTNGIESWTQLRLANGVDGWAPSEFLVRTPLQLWSGFWPVAASGGR